MFIIINVFSGKDGRYFTLEDTLSFLASVSNVPNEGMEIDDGESSF